MKNVFKKCGGWKNEKWSEFAEMARNLIGKMSEQFPKFFRIFSKFFQKIWKFLGGSTFVGGLRGGGI
jgi:hypothetical protein